MNTKAYQSMKAEIIDAWVFMRKNNDTISDDVLDFMKKASLNSLEEMYRANLDDGTTTNFTKSVVGDVIGCFEEHTLVRRPGGTTSHIFELRPRDCVQSYDLRTKELTYSYIKRIIISSVDHYYVINGIECSPNQQFYAPIYKKWVPARRLSKGDKITALSPTKNETTVRKIKRFDDELTVYGLELEGMKNFFVISGEDIATMMLVHNIKI